MQKEKPKSRWGVISWVVWIVMTIVSFFVSAYIWTHVLARFYGTMQEPGAPIVWVSCVFGTWIIFLIPMIIFMYKNVDRAYEEMRAKREQQAARSQETKLNYKVGQLTSAERLVGADVRDSLQKMKPFVQGGFLVQVTLKDARQFPFVFLTAEGELAGIYDVDQAPFQGSDISVAQDVSEGPLPEFKEERWLRLNILEG